MLMVWEKPYTGPRKMRFVCSMEEIDPISETWRFHKAGMVDYAQNISLILWKFIFLLLSSVLYRSWEFANIQLILQSK